MRKIKDKIMNILTYIASAMGLIVLIVLLGYIFMNGLKILSWDLITSDYHETVYNTKLEKSQKYKLGDFKNPEIENAYFSSTWGITLIDSIDLTGEKIVKVAYVALTSPFQVMLNTSIDELVEIKEGYIISKIILSNENDDFISALSRDGAEDMIKKMEMGTIITDMISYTGGGGIRGSLLTTICLIILTLLIVLPLGVGAAIYLHEYAKDNQFTGIIRSMIDVTSGIPSIIFGLVGAIIFIPFMNVVIKSNGGSIASGALTLSIMLLPIVIRTTEEALKVVPDKYRNASLALGASRTQTVFKVVLPNAIGGIMTAALLSIGRIVGESAALIYAVGTAIKDTAVINEKSTSLSVHIWSLMGGENPKFEAACAISIIILLVVLILNIIVKLISRKINKNKES